MIWLQAGKASTPSPPSHRHRRIKRPWCDPLGALRSPPGFSRCIGIDRRVCRSSGRHSWVSSDQLPSVRLVIGALPGASQIVASFVVCSGRGAGFFVGSLRTSWMDAQASPTKLRIKWHRIPMGPYCSQSFVMSGLSSRRRQVPILRAWEGLPRAVPF